MQHSCHMMSMLFTRQIQGTFHNFSLPGINTKPYAIGTHLAHKVFDGSAVEAVLAHMVLCVVLMRQGIHVGRRRHCLMEGCVKDSDLLGTLDTYLRDSLLHFTCKCSLSAPFHPLRTLRLQEGQYLRAAREDSACCNNALKVCRVVQGSQVSCFLDDLHDLVVHKHRL